MGFSCASTGIILGAHLRGGDGTVA